MSDEKSNHLAFATVDAFVNCLFRFTSGENNAAKLVPDVEGEVLGAILFNNSHNGVWYCQKRKFYAVAVKRMADGQKGFLWFRLQPELVAGFEPQNDVVYETRPSHTSMMISAAYTAFTHLKEWWDCKAEEELKGGIISMLLQLEALSEMPWGRTLFSASPIMNIKETIESVEAEVNGIYIEMPDSSGFNIMEDGPQWLKTDSTLSILPDGSVQMGPPADKLRVSLLEIEAVGHA